MVVGNIALYPKKPKNLPSKVREQIFYKSKYLPSTILHKNAISKLVF